MDSGREEGSAMLKWVSAFFVVIAIAGLGAYYFVAKPDLSALLDRDEPVVSRSSAPAPDAEPSTAPEEVKEVRYALLIANEDYPSVVGRLKKPHEDVARMAAALKQAGFPSANIKTLPNANQSEMNQAVAEFASLLRASGRGSVGFFYYSGHGGSAEKEGKRENYLIPAKTSVTGAEQLPILGVPVSGIVDSLALANAKAVFIVSDACRNTLPITSSKGGAADKGMVQVPRRSGVYIAFATADGATTPDDGLFSEALAEQIVQPGQTADRAFTLALRKVASRRPGGRLPFSADGLNEDICFAGGCKRRNAETSLPSDEAVALGQALDSGDVSQLQAFLDQFPESRSRQLVSQQIATLESASLPEVSIPPADSAPTADSMPASAAASSNSTASAHSFGSEEARSQISSGEPYASTEPEYKTSTQRSSSEEPSSYDPMSALAMLDRLDKADAHEVVSIEADRGYLFVSSVDFSPDGNRIAALSTDGATVFDASNGQPLVTLAKQGNVSIRAVRFSPNGGRVATISSTREIKVWDSTSGRPLMTLNPTKALGNDDNRPLEGFSVSFSPDGTRILAATAENVARVWEIRSGRVVVTLTGHEGVVLSASFSHDPDGKQIVTASADGTAKVWDASSGRLIKTLNGHERGVRTADFSPNGELIVTASEDGTAKIWNASNGQVVGELAELDLTHGPATRFASASFSPNGALIATSPYGTERAKIWNASTGTVVAILDRRHNISASFSPDGNKLVAGFGEGHVGVWKLEFDE